ncbi:MAG: molybdate ABC transporter permease subunit, partial [Chloroflexota bacterium]
MQNDTRESDHPAAYGRGLLVAGAVPGLLLIVLPLVGLLWRAVAVRAWAGLPGDGLSVAIWLSLYTTAAATVMTVVLGTPLAFALARGMFPYNR